MNCDCIIHPFQNDPGTSQNQRIMDALLSGAAKIDARTMADLLNYFVQMSRHINYYDLDLNVSDWQPFFRKSTPFVLASIIKFPLKNTEDNFKLHETIFESKPSPAGLQLLYFSLFHRFINSINNWHNQLNDSSLPIAAILDNMIRIKLQSPVRQFIMLSNTASKNYGIRSIDFLKISSNPVWGLDSDSLTATDKTFPLTGTGEHQRMLGLYSNLNTLMTVFLDVVRSLSYAAERNLEQSFIPMKEELQKKHPPHLALLFAFLNIFRQLQSNLNEYTRKHLDYFYKEILHFKSEGAVPDRANILFEIQDALKSYLLKKGLKVKDGKDDNRQDILFELDDDIVVNQTRIGDKRTLFVNNQTAYAKTCVEGVYIAPAAQMADGVEKEFADDPKNFPTLGSKYSKYEDPETRLLKAYPNARIGFALASPVLLLQEGSTRTITIEIPCLLKNSVCSGIRMFPGDDTKNCCNDKQTGDIDPDMIPYPDFIDADKFYGKVNDALKETYYYISEDILKAALKKGISAKLADHMRESFLTGKEDPLCYCPVRRRKLEAVVTQAEFDAVKATITPGEILILDELVKSRRAFNFLFSGEEEWIEPSSIIVLELKPPVLPGSNELSLNIELTLAPDKGAVTFFNSEALAEDLGTTQPLLKVQLDDKIKLTKIDLKKLADQKESGGDCCLLKDEDGGDVSLYHFFRNVIVRNVNTPVITVKVCGMKKFIVQNDESVMDVNGPIYPFGARPDIVDFNVTDAFIKYYITKVTIADAENNGLTPAGKTKLNNLIIATGSYPIKGTLNDVDSFLSGILSPADKNIVKTLLQTKNYSTKNLIGPNFYIGSKEIFCKNWDEIFVNLNWKDKPDNFRDYYQAYLASEEENPPHRKLFGLDDQEFQINLSVLENGAWKGEKLHPSPSPAPPYDEETTLLNSVTGTNNRRLFPKTYTASSCEGGNDFQQSIHCKKEFFPISGSQELDSTPASKYDVTSRNGFLRVNLQNQDFLHGDYAYVLARQMNAAAMLALLDKNNNPIKVEEAIYYDNDNKALVVFNSNTIKQTLTDSLTISSRVRDDINAPNNINDLANNPGPGNPIPANDSDDIRKIINPADLLNPTNLNLTGDVEDLKQNIIDMNNLVNSENNFQAIIPKEPWTPVISNILLDYTAKATLQDIDLVHLYPYQGTYKSEEISIQPALLPTHCDEGTLFLGLSNLVPGNNLNLLFQMAEATSDSESDKETVFWHYLDSNVWKSLRPGFEVLDDATNNLTGSGIIKLALPANMTSENTVMPGGMHWIKAAIPKNSRAVCETIGIHPHAIHVVFTNDEANNKLRLSKPLQAGSISKLEIADASVKSVIQTYESYGGLVPEIEQQFYVRVSETLRHKGRAIQSFDYERLVLQKFPQLFKVKCINHSLGLSAHEYINDFPYAGGYVLMVVIPDLNKLKSGNSFEPKAPVSLLEEINDFIRQRTSPFVRFRAMNPRYEQVDFCLKIKLQKNKDENFHKEQVKEDIKRFLAPWAVGDYYKLTFGQCVYRSDIIQFLETRDYLDFIGDMRMARKGETPDSLVPKVCPDTPRSILIAGEIEVCIIPPECENWGDYYACHEKQVQPCDTKPEQISDYCKKRKIIIT